MSVLAGQWKSDGSDDPSFGDKQMTFSLDVSEETQTLAMKTTKTRPSNFLYELDPPANSFFLEVLVDEKTKGSSLSVGVAKLSNLKVGYGTKGMLYNGNLTNGMAALKTSFGPFLKAGDRVIVEYVLSGDFIEVTYYLDGECLGTGFRVPKENEAFHPVLSMTGEVTVTATVTAEIPPHIIKGYTDPNFMRKTYNIVQAKDESGTTIIPTEGGDGREIKLTVNPTKDDKVTLTVVVCNILSIGKNFDTTENGISMSSVEGSDVVSSTRSKPIPPYDVVEKAIRQSMATGWAAINFSADGKAMTILDANGESVATGERIVGERGQPALASY
ncbi:unnamed protein product [Cylindrotheca closterium]|uniref:B30.2/SPRY domain-containing protein n=1 Tax=Cylindrotheca closterium TaxID=2856 RepID=A0AAD2PUG9_9STRA|nr:unnamed protein product [Cylindrotheca closterium]